MRLPKLAVDDARNVDVGLHTVLFASFDDIVVRADSLEIPQDQQ